MKLASPVQTFDRMVGGWSLQQSVCDAVGKCIYAQTQVRKKEMTEWHLLLGSIGSNLKVILDPKRICCHTMSIRKPRDCLAPYSDIMFCSG